MWISLLVWSVLKWSVHFQTIKQLNTAITITTATTVDFCLNSQVFQSYSRLDWLLNSKSQLMGILQQNLFRMPYGQMRPTGADVAPQEKTNKYPSLFLSPTNSFKHWRTFNHSSKICTEWKLISLQVPKIHSYSCMLGVSAATFTAHYLTYSVRQKKVSPKLFLPFSQQPLWIFKWNFTQILLIHCLIMTKLLNFLGDHVVISDVLIMFAERKPHHIL